jgi:hypothetical protein
MEPDDLEVLQVEVEPVGKEPPVRVVVDGPTRTQELPHKGGATFTKALAASPAQPIRVLRADPRRAVARLVSLDQTFLFAFTQATASDPSTMARWPANVPLVISAATDIFLASYSTAATVTVVTELWATGDA